MVLVQRIMAVCLTVVLAGLLGLVAVSVSTYGGLVSALRDVDAVWMVIAEKDAAHAQLATWTGETAVTEAGLGIETHRRGMALGKSSEQEIDSRQSPFSADKLRRFEEKHQETRGRLARALTEMEGRPETKELASRTRIEVQRIESELHADKQRFDHTVRIYNERVRRFPTVIVAGMMGFSPKPSFENLGGSR